MKKKVLVVAIIAICASLAAYGTLAYFTHEDTATNVITAGDLKIELQELAIPENGGPPVPFENASDVMPGTSVSKIVQVKNISSQDAWVRVSVDKSIILANNSQSTVDLSLISFDLNTKNWSKKDGYYYYNTVLSPNQVTEPLFTRVEFSTSMGNMYQHSKAIIEVNAHATQAIHNGNTVFEAVGWPNAQ